MRAPKLEVDMPRQRADRAEEEFVVLNFLMSRCMSKRPRNPTEDAYVEQNEL